MILKLIEAQIIRLAAAVARDRKTQGVDELRKITSLTTTLESSVIDLFIAAGLDPATAEIAAKVYALGWADGVHRGTGETLSDAVLERRYASDGEAAVLPASPRLLQ